MRSLTQLAGNQATTAVVQREAKAERKPSIFLEVTGSKQGKFGGKSGATSIAGVDVTGMIPAADFSFKLKAPRRKGDKVREGAVDRPPVTFTKATDETTPKFAQAIEENEVLEFKVLWFDSDARGIQQQTKSMLFNGCSMEGFDDSGAETISFVYSGYSMGVGTVETASGESAKK